MSTLMAREFAAPSAPTPRAWPLARFALFPVAFGVMLAVAAALVAHGAWRALSAALADRRDRTQSRKRDRRAKQAPSYRSALA